MYQHVVLHVIARAGNEYEILRCCLVDLLKSWILGYGDRGCLYLLSDVTGLIFASRTHEDENVEDGLRLQHAYIYAVLKGWSVDLFRGRDNKLGPDDPVKCKLRGAEISPLPVLIETLVSAPQTHPTESTEHRAWLSLAPCP